MPDTARLAIPLLEEALSLDPEYAVAHAHLAWSREWCFTRGGLNEADRTATLVHARTALPATPMTRPRLPWRVGSSLF